MTKIQKHGKDFISLLDEDLLIKILCSTESYKCAVICSVLSKRWINFYKMLPCLYLGDHEFCELEEDGSNFGEIKPLVYERAATAIIRHQARVHVLNLTAFLNLSNRKWCLEHFTEQNIQNLTLRMSDYDGQFQLIPLCLFTCSSLVNLDLSVYQKPRDVNLSTLQGFPNLIGCNLKFEISSEYEHVNEWLDLLSSRCPLLHHLEVDVSLLENLAIDPMRIQSSSLVDLDIEFTNICEDMQIQLTVQTPELLSMKMRCYLIDPCAKAVVVQIAAPKLLEISVPERKHVLVKLSGCLEKMEGIVTAKWSKHHHHYHHLTTLHVANKSSSSLEILKIVGKLWTLKSLKLSGIHALPMNFWLLLLNLPLLETMAFSNCCFRKGEEESLDSHFSDPEICKKSILREIKFTNDLHSNIDSEVYILCVILQNTPNLQMLRFVLKKEICETKNNYALLFGKLLTPGDWLNTNELPDQVEYTILKKSAFSNLHCLQKIRKELGIAGHK